MWHGVRVALPRTTTVHKGLGKRKGCQRRYYVVGSTACRFRVEASFHPKFSPSRACDYLDMRARRCITRLPQKHHTGGVGGYEQTLGTGPRDPDARDGLPTSSRISVLSTLTEYNWKRRKLITPVLRTIAVRPVRYQGLIVARRGLGWWDAAQLLQLFEKKPSNIVRWHRF